MKGPEMQFMRVISTHVKRIVLYLPSCPKFIEIDKSDGCVQKTEKCELELLAGGRGVVSRTSIRSHLYLDSQTGSAFPILVALLADLSSR